MAAHPPGETVGGREATQLLPAHLARVMETRFPGEPRAAFFAGAFLALSDQPPEGTSPRVHFDRGRVAVSDRSGHTLLDLGGFVTGAVGIPINGAIADSIGLQKSLMTHVVLVIVTIAIAWFLPSEAEMERLSTHAETERAHPATVAP